MGVCYLQHRIKSGFNYTPIKCGTSKGNTNYDIILSCVISLLIFIYVYMILLTLAMVVDFKPSRDLGIIHDEYFEIYTGLMDIRIYLNNMYLVILTKIYILVRFRGSVPGRYNGISIVRFKNLNVSLTTMTGYIVSYFYVALNLLLIVICFPGIMNPGPMISVMYNNVRGFVPPCKLNEPDLPLNIGKVQEFQSYIFDKEPSIVVVNETWLSNEHFDNEIFPNNSYKVFRADRSHRTHPLKNKGGGVLIAVKSDLNIESKVVGASCGAEILSVEIKHGNEIFCLTTCYRVGTLGEDNYNMIEKHLRSIRRVRKYKRHIFIGDLNLHQVQWPDAVTNNGLQDKFVHLFNDLGMEQIIDAPTHEHGKILDLLYVSNTSFLKNLKVLPKNQVCSSDHYGITFNLTTKVKSNVKKRKIFDFKRADWEGLNNDLNTVSWNSFLTSCDPNQGWIFFRNVLYLLMDKHIPTITIKNQSRPPWFDSETLHLCKKKERLHRKFKSSGSAEDYSRYAQCRREFKELVKLKMESNMYNDDSDLALISKKFWGYVKSTKVNSKPVWNGSK